LTDATTHPQSRSLIEAGEALGSEASDGLKPKWQVAIPWLQNKATTKKGLQDDPEGFKRWQMIAVSKIHSIKAGKHLVQVIGEP
jgi:hypothetical protein